MCDESMLVTTPEPNKIHSARKLKRVARVLVLSPVALRSPRRPSAMASVISEAALQGKVAKA